MNTFTLPYGEQCIPSEFSNPAGAVIYSDGKGGFTASISVPDWTGGATPNVRYINADTGNDTSGDGLTAATAWRSMSKAWAVASPADIIVMSDYVPRAYAGQTTGSAQAIPARMRIRSGAPSGRSVIGAFDQGTAFTWSLHSTGVYTTSANVAASVFDRKYSDSKNVPAALTVVSTLADCQGLAGSVFFDYANGTNIYVHLKDNRIPDAQVIVSRNVGCWSFSQSASGALRLEGLTTVFPYSGSDGLRLSSTSTPNTAVFSQKDCVHIGSYYNALAIVRTSLSISENCACAYSGRDGFNYTDGANPSPMVIYEIDCTGKFAGASDYIRGPVLTGSDNCSTCHSGMQIARINCGYSDARGPVVADVNGAVSVNYGVSANRCALTSGDSRANFYHNTELDSRGGSMALVGCVSDSSLGEYMISTPDSTRPVSVSAWRGNPNGLIFPGSVTS